MMERGIDCEGKDCWDGVVPFRNVVLLEDHCLCSNIRKIECQLFELKLCTCLD